MTQVMTLPFSNAKKGDSWVTHDMSQLQSKIDPTSTEEIACLLTRDSSHDSNSSIHYPEVPTTKLKVEALLKLISFYVDI